MIGGYYEARMVSRGDGPLFLDESQVLDYCQSFRCKRTGVCLLSTTGSNRFLVASEFVATSGAKYLASFLYCGLIYEGRSYSVIRVPCDRHGDLRDRAT